MARRAYEPELDVPFKGVVFTLDAIAVPGRVSRRARLRHRKVLRAWEQAVMAAREAPARVATLEDDAARAAGVDVERLRQALREATPRLQAFEGLTTLLTAMDRHDLPRALVSDRAPPLGQLGAARGWTKVVVGEELGCLRPHSGLLAPIADELGVPTDQLVVVGAGPLDEAFATAAGCPLLLRDRDWAGLAAVGRKLLGGTWAGYTRQMRGSSMR